LVKGRKGIGKFAGLIVAQTMELETRARGQRTKLTIPKDELLSAVADLENISLPFETAPIGVDVHGTHVTLRDLLQHLAFPIAERLRQLLVLEYGREDDFSIFVNSEKVGVEDVPGASTTEEHYLPMAGPVKLTFKITDEPQRAKQAGIVIRIGGKIVGKPSHFGLDIADDIPRKLLRRIYGEVEADGLMNDVSADWAAIIENSKGYAELTAWVRQHVHNQLESTFKTEVNLARARLQREINQRLEQMPEHRRRFAETALQKILQRFYGEPDERVRPIVSVVLDALERDEYRVILEKINQTSRQDVVVFADALAEFGLLELSLVAQQTKSRKEFLDALDTLVSEPNTTEAVVHRAFENNLWLFGSDFALVGSNQTLAKVIERYLHQRFTGKRSASRPDLLLVSQLGRKYTLVEFKRPSHTLTREDVSQAEQYRDDLTSQVHPVDLILVGKDYDIRLLQNPAPNAMIFSYDGLINRARQELEWLLAEFKAPGGR